MSDLLRRGVEIVGCAVFVAGLLVVAVGRGGGWWWCVAAWAVALVVSVVRFRTARRQAELLAAREALRRYLRRGPGLGR